MHVAATRNKTTRHPNPKHPAPTNAIPAKLANPTLNTEMVFG
jgi:hypothetical protein